MREGGTGVCVLGRHAILHKVVRGSRRHWSLCGGNEGIQQV